MVEMELTHRASPLIARYRSLKATYDDLKEQMDEIRQIVTQIVVEEGEYADEQGHAKFRENPSRVTFDGKAVDKYARIWAESDDPSLKQAGQILLAVRKESEPSRSIVIK